MSGFLPINLSLKDRPALLVGGGAIALRKGRLLAEAGAMIRVVAPDIDPALEALDGVETRRRRFEESDLDGAGLVIAATADPALNRRIGRLARARGLLVNVVDVPELCDFIFPAILRRGELTISFSTSGASPSLARMLRDRAQESLEARLGGPLLARMARLRERSRRELVCAGARRAAAETLAAMALGGRRRDEPASPDPMEALIDELAALARRESRTSPTLDVIG